MKFIKGQYFYGDGDIFEGEFKEKNETYIGKFTSQWFMICKFT